MGGLSVACVDWTLLWCALCAGVYRLLVLALNLHLRLVWQVLKLVEQNPFVKILIVHQHEHFALRRAKRTRLAIRSAGIVAEMAGAYRQGQLLLSRCAQRFDAAR